MSMHIRSARIPREKTPRPRVLPLMLAVFCISNLIRSALALQQVVQLPDVPGSASFVYVAVTSAGWAVVFAVCTIATLDDLLQYLSQRTSGEQEAHLERVKAYRQRYGVS